MPWRLLLRQASSMLAGFAGRLNRVDNPSIARAAAQMTIECLCHGSSVVRPTLVYQGRGPDENSRDAESALHAPFEHKRFAQNAAFLIGNPLERHHVVALRLFRFAQAG